MRLAVLLLAGAACWAQEAGSGFELRTTISTAGFYTHLLSEAPRDGGPLAGGFRALLYPTWKLNGHWAVSGAVQVHSRPYFPDEFSSQGYGIRTTILQGNLSYSQFWSKGSLVIRAGQLSSAFGSFLLRYDPATNPLILSPPGYGYYEGVTLKGLTGAQADATVGKLDLRAQFVNSSPVNPRSVFDKDQYGTWAGGVGYTIQQGFRVGVSAFRGPYLDRHYEYYFPGEAPPRGLPASGYGIDVQWGRGPWNVYGELQKFQFAYRAIPTFNEQTGYAEVRRVLAPRWFVAARIGFEREGDEDAAQSYEAVAAYRPNTHQILKFGYLVQLGADYRGTLGNVAVVQLVTTLRPFSFARD
jgi:hypothetical protein